MSADLIPFREGEPCEKCGHRGLGLRWSAATAAKTDIAGTVVQPACPERLVLTCLRCGYWWLRGPAEHGRQPAMPLESPTRQHFGGGQY